jgi:SMODS and SLOG-associating 2TM effector domain 1
MTYEEAEQEIGESEDGDHLIEPHKHASNLSPSASQLAGVLKASDASMIANAFRTRDHQAVATQDKFKSTASLANVAVLVTAASTGILLATASLGSVLGAAVTDVSVPVLAWLSAVAGAVAAALLFTLRQGDMLKRWMSQRAEAEGQRLSYFRWVCQLRPGGGPSLQLLQLAYFRRYLMDAQINWFERRGDEHQYSADRTLRLSAVAVGIGALSSFAVAGLTARGAAWAALAVLSIFGTALASFAATRDTIQQDRRNTERYSSTAKTLGELKRKLPEVAHDIQGGASEALDGYVAVVCDLLSSENKQWMEETEKTRLAVEDLEKLLSDARSRADERAKRAGTDLPQ